MKPKPTELFVNTHGVCLFCIKDADASPPTSGDENEREGGTEVSLRSICRYLKVDPSSVLLKSLKQSKMVDEGDENARKLCDFSVMLCEKCSKLASQLTLVIKELEVAQMKVNHHLQCLDEILNPADKNEGNARDSWKDVVRDKMARTENNSVGLKLEEFLVENLREETMVNCSETVKVIKSVAPKVCLQRLNANQMEHPVTSPVTSRPAKNIVLKERNAAQEGVDSDNDHSSASSGINEDQQPLTVFKQSTNQLRRMKTPVKLEKDKLPKRQKLSIAKTARETFCPFCSEVILQKTKMNEHKVMNHIGQVFSFGNKLSKVTHKQFSACCVKLVELEIKGSKVTSRVKDIPITHCSYCSASFRDMKDLKVHLCTHHLRILQQKIVKFQKKAFSNHQLPVTSSVSNVVVVRHEY